MTGTKFGCGMALRGACTVHVDGARALMCHARRRHRRIRNHHNRGDRRNCGRRQNPEGLVDREVIQCGYCQSGQIDDTMSGNICRCGGLCPHSPSD
jgi:isoquinoline 1-oxidoreductase alpha subunit